MNDFTLIILVAFIFFVIYTSLQFVGIAVSSGLVFNLFKTKKESLTWQIRRHYDVLCDDFCEQRTTLYSSILRATLNSSITSQFHFTKNRSHYRNMICGNRQDYDLTHIKSKQHLSSNIDIYLKTKRQSTVFRLMI